MRFACSCSRNRRTSARILSFGASMNCASSFCVISASVKWPSQSSRIMRPVPSTRIAPSGKSTTGASVVPPQRHPAANFGMLASTSSATTSSSVPRLRFRVDAKRPRRRPSRLDVGEVQRVELSPQNVALITQRLDDGFLFGARGGMTENILNGKGRIFRRFGQSRFEIVESGAEIGVMLAQFFHAQRDEIAGKQFGERGSHVFKQ